MRFTHLRPSHTLPPGSARQQKLATLLEIYSLTWIFLLFATIVTGRSSLGSVYYATAWNGTAFLGTVLGLVEAWIRARHAGSDVGAGVGQEVDEGGPDEQRRLVRGVRYEVGGTDTGATAEGEEVRAYEDREDQEGAIVETEPTEITPLMAQHRNARENGQGKEVELVPKEEVGWWILQMLLVVPFPLVLISQVGLLLMGALSQTLIDGSSAITGMFNCLQLEYMLINRCSLRLGIFGRTLGSPPAGTICPQDAPSPHYYHHGTLCGPSHL